MVTVDEKRDRQRARLWGIAPEARIYACPARVTAHCDQGDGRAPRKRCRSCGSELITFVGTWGVFEHRGDGDYPIERAKVTCRTRLSAERNIRDEPTWVVRFVHRTNEVRIKITLETS